MRSGMDRGNVIFFGALAGVPVAAALERCWQRDRILTEQMVVARVSDERSEGEAPAMERPKGLNLGALLRETWLAALMFVGAKRRARPDSWREA